MKRKPKTLPKLTEECATLLQKIVRMKQAAYLNSPYIACVTCGKVDHWKSMHGGHFISRTWTATKILEENIHPQCPGCNTFKPERVADDYFRFMVDTYGYEFVNDLIDRKRVVTKRTRAELNDTLAEFKAQAKQLESEVPV